MKLYPERIVNKSYFRDLKGSDILINLYHSNYSAFKRFRKKCRYASMMRSARGFKKSLIKAVERNTYPRI